MFYHLKEQEFLFVKNRLMIMVYFSTPFLVVAAEAGLLG